MALPEFVGLLLAMFVVCMSGYFVTHKLEEVGPTQIANLLLLAPFLPLTVGGVVWFVVSGSFNAFLPVLAGIIWFYVLALMIVYVRPVREKLTYDSSSWQD